MFSLRKITLFYSRLFGITSEDQDTQFPIECSIELGII